MKVKEKESLFHKNQKMTIFKKKTKSITGIVSQFEHAEKCFEKLTKLFMIGFGVLGNKNQKLRFSAVARH